MKLEQAFHHFNEAEITFPPTYRYIIGTSELDLKYFEGWGREGIIKFSP